jgi:hypothetical protein
VIFLVVNADWGAENVILISIYFTTCTSSGLQLQRNRSGNKGSATVDTRCRIFGALLTWCLLGMRN